MVTLPAAREIAGASSEDDDEEEEEEEEEDDGDNVVCAACEGDEEAEGNEILLCDGAGCEKAFHMKCLPTPLSRVPEGDWYCPECEPKYGNFEPRRGASARERIKEVAKLDAQEEARAAAAARQWA